MNLISTKTILRCLLMCFVALSFALSGHSTESAAVLDDGGAAWHCPDEHVYIKCGELYDNLDHYGYPKASYGYGHKVHIHKPTVHKYLDKCGRGKIVRTWKIKYHYEWYTCTQTIHIKDGDGYGGFDGYHDVHWPKDHHIYECGGNLHPDHLPYGKNWPEFKHKGCSQLGLRYEDKVYPYHNSGGYGHDSYGYHHKTPCKVIYRTWELIDWCQYNEHHGKHSKGHVPGRWTYVQKLYIYDDEAPEFTYCPEDVEADGGDCKGGKTYVKIPKAEATDNCGDVVIKYTKKKLGSDHYSKYDKGETFHGNDASGYYEPGLTLVTFTAYDICGNATECEFLVTVTAEDNKPPAVLAISSLTVALMQTDSSDGYVTLWPEEFNTSSYDNCTAPEDLIFSLEPDTFTCADFGSNMVKFMVTDESGNMDYAMVEVIVQANSFDCLGGTIAGNVMSDAGSGVENVEISLMEGMQKMTDTKGAFAFEEIPLGRKVDITPSKNTDYRERLDMYDYTILSMHVDGIREIRDPYQLIAADVDGNKVIDRNDLRELQYVILGIKESFSSNNSWQFVPMDYQLPDTVTVFEADMPHSVAIEPYNGGDMDVQFRAIKIGDLGSLFDPEIESDSRGNRSLVTGNQLLNAGDLATVPFTFDDLTSANTMSFSLALDENDLELVEIHDGALAVKGSVNFASPERGEGLINGSFFTMSEQTFGKDEVLFELVVRAKRSTQLKDGMTLNTSALPAETGGTTGGFNDLQIQYEAVEGTKLTLYQNSPNPVLDETTIGFYLPSAGDVTLSVQDANGRMLTQRSGAFDKGYQQMTLQRSELNASGLVFYQLEHNGERKTMKMVVIQ